MAQDSLRFDGAKLGRIASRKGLLRGEVGKLAGVSGTTQCQAFLGRPIGVRAARQIAKALGTPLHDLIVDEPETAEAASSMAD